jgi:hypothetical protein
LRRVCRSLASSAKTGSRSGSTTTSRCPSTWLLLRCGPKGREAHPSLSTVGIRFQIVNCRIIARRIVRCSNTLVAMHNKIVPFLFLLCYVALAPLAAPRTLPPSPPASIVERGRRPIRWCRGLSQRRAEQRHSGRIRWRCCRLPQGLTCACLPLCPRTHSFRRDDSAIAIRFLDSSDQCYPLVGEAFA